MMIIGNKEGSEMTYIAMTYRKPLPLCTLISVLPVTARYDHGLLQNGRWIDLPVGSFRESGTNINTTIYMTGK